ncbi:hypothetical protein BJX65DRAFT_23066 [Aspergillus insuetus]
MSDADYQLTQRRTEVRRGKKEGGRKARGGQKHDKWETRGWASNCTHSSCTLHPIDSACRVSVGWRRRLLPFAGLNKTGAHRGISRRSYKADDLSSASISTVWDTLERRNAAVKGPASDEAQSGLRWSSPSLEVSACADIYSCPAGVLLCRALSWIATACAGQRKEVITAEESSNRFDLRTRFQIPSNGSFDCAPRSAGRTARDGLFEVSVFQIPAVTRHKGTK